VSQTVQQNPLTIGWRAATTDLGDRLVVSESNNVTIVIDDDGYLDDWATGILQDYTVNALNNHDALTEALAEAIKLLETYDHTTYKIRDLKVILAEASK